MTNVTGFTAKNKKHISYPNLPSAMRPVLHSDDIYYIKTILNIWVILRFSYNICICLISDKLHAIFQKFFKVKQDSGLASKNNSNAV
jgi:hypothetical protein